VTVTDAVPLAEPEVAVIVAVPLATAATSPADETLATDELEDSHVTDAPLIVAPPWSRTVGISCCVSPNDPKLSVVGERVTVVAMGGSVVPPQPARLTRRTVRRARRWVRA